MKPISKKEQLKYINKNKTNKKKLHKECMELWAELVKAKAGYKCEWWNCRKIEYLNAHHLFSKSHFSTRYDLDNGMSLCSGHHSLNTNSAHKDGAFALKVTGQFPGYEALRSKQFYLLLERKAKSPSKLDLKLEKMYLLNEAKKYIDILPTKFKEKYEIE